MFQQPIYAVLMDEMVTKLIALCASLAVATAAFAGDPPHHHKHPMVVVHHHHKHKVWIKAHRDKHGHLVKGHYIWR